MRAGAFERAEPQAWILAVKAELARHENRQLMAAFLDCVKCYEVLGRQLAYEAALETPSPSFACDRHLCGGRSLPPFPSP